MKTLFSLRNEFSEFALNKMDKKYREKLPIENFGTYGTFLTPKYDFFTFIFWARGKNPMLIILYYSFPGPTTSNYATWSSRA